MARRLRWVAGAAVTALLAATAPPVAAEPADGDYTSFRFYDEAGNFLTPGQFKHYTPETATFSTSGTPQRAGVTATKGFTKIPPSTEYYGLNLGSGTDQPLAVGTYTDTTSNDPFLTLGPGLEMGGSGRSCSEVVGTFTISQIEFDDLGKLTKLSVTFEQYCDGAAKAQYGSVAYHADQPAAPVPHGPPDAVTDVSAAGAIGSLTLSWRNPTQSFAAVVIRRVASTVPPTTPDVGDLVYTGSAESVKVDGLASNTIYTFTFFTRNADGVYGPRAYLTTKGSYLIGTQCNPPRIDYGTGTIVEAVLRDTDTQQLVSRPVDLWTRPTAGSAWTMLTRANTDGSGYVAFRVNPARNTDYRFSFAGVENVTGTDSVPCTVSIYPILALSGPKIGKVGQAFTIKATMKPAPSGAKLQLLEKAPRKPYKVIATATVSKGAAKFTVKPKKGTYSYALRSPSSRSLAGTDSERSIGVKVK